MTRQHVRGTWRGGRFPRKGYVDPSALETREERALAIARLSKAGLSARQIAERLGCTTRTVHRYRTWLRAA